ncbi:MAG: hypothetical protein F7B59_04815, partial [Desulfurococcales archaeon]|nr:hypothetical protein [Desulfurococcales archaeon]
MNFKQQLKIAYALLPPPLSALPAKYHAPISLLLHSFSTGLVADELAELAELEDSREIAFFLGITHDIHQKLVEDGLATLKTAKNYIREKLDELGKLDYYRYVDDALDIDACGKGIPVRSLPEKLSLICHIGDMTQGSLEGVSLLYWLGEQVRKLHPDLTVRFYSIMIPQVFARSYIMERIYQRYIADTDHLALASPWGLYVITYEDELPEVLNVSWDNLRIDAAPIPYNSIIDVEKTGEPATINRINMSGDEVKNKLWSRFARMFYSKSLLMGGKPIYPTLPASIEGLFVNIKFTDVEFRDISKESTHTCALCGLRHLAEQSMMSSMFSKIAGAKVKSEKWNRFIPSHIVVRAGKSGQWGHRIGLCPLCTLEALAIRHSGFTGKLTGVLGVSISKPIPVSLLHYLGRVVAESNRINEPIVGRGAVNRLVLDYSSATIGTQEVSEPKTENLFRHKTKRGADINGVFVRIGKLISWGIYPVKFLPSIDTSIVDRPAVTPYNFPTLDFPVTSKEYGHLLPWIASLLVTVGKKERSEALQYLDFRPEHAPLALLTLNKSDDVFSYEYVSEALLS